MSGKMPSQEPTTKSPYRPPALWAWLSAAAAVLAAAGSVVGLLEPDLIYGRETPVLFNAALAQDVVNLFLVAPLMLVLAVRASHGSRRSWLCLIGFLAFTAYNYAIYTFSIHFGPLFLVWVTVLGLAVFTASCSLAGLPLRDPAVSFAILPVRAPAWFLITLAVVFALLWLSEIVPDLLAARPSTSATTWSVPTNPVHVLDLALFLPAVCASGVLLLQQHPIGYATGPGALIFLGLTSLPILVTPFVAQARGDAPRWVIIAPVGIIAATTLLMLWRLLHALRPVPAADRTEPS